VQEGGNGMTAPIAIAQMAGILRRAVNDNFGQDIADPEHGDTFEMTAPATGQRFRVTVAEIPGWSDQMDRELAEVTGTEMQA
jgi:hypothetical protein